MKHATRILGASLLVFAISISASAAAGSCSFKKNLQKSGVTFDISSRPAVGCAVQVIDISVLRGGKHFSRLRADVDYLAENAWTADINGDGQPELLISSRCIGNEACGALDVYSLDGNTIRRASLPELHDKIGYRGGDRFHLAGRQIIRTVPVYNDDDAIDKPTGGSRIVTYDFSEGKIVFRAQQDNKVVAAHVLNNSDIERAAVKTVLAKASKPLIRDITTSASAIEITADAPISTFKIMKLEKPERVAIDIPDASSHLAGKSVKIDKSGISRVRVGRNKGFLRIVLDSTGPVFPNHTITMSDNDKGLKIVFGDE